MTLGDFEILPGVVIDNEDPMNQYRVKACSPGLFDTSTMDKEDITQMFDYTLDPMRLFNGIMAHYRKIEEQERQAKLVEARKKYVYGFKEVEFDELFGKNVFDLDRGYVCYGYLTFKDKVISDYPVQLGKSIQGFLDKLNEDYNEGKKYRVERIWQVFSVNNDDKKKSYVCEKCIENKKKKYIDEVIHIIRNSANVATAKNSLSERFGLTEVQAKAEGFDPVSVITVVDDKAHYYAGASTFVIKMIADRATERLLGVQVVGAGAVDKVVDVAVTGIMLKGTLTDLSDLDLAYAPPFSTAIHPFEHTLNVLKNKIRGTFDTFTPAEYAAGEAEGYKVIDACLQPSIEGAPYVELTTVEGPIDGFGLDEKILLVCNKGKRAYLLQNRMKFYGYTNTKVLEGGISFNEVEV